MNVQIKYYYYFFYVIGVKKENWIPVWPSIWGITKACCIDVFVDVIFLRQVQNQLGNKNKPFFCLHLVSSHH